MINILKKIYDFVKRLVLRPKETINSIRIPSLVDFIFKPWDDAIMGAPKENWNRLNLGKKSPIGLPVWSLFAILGLVLAVYFFKDALIFLINNVAAAFSVMILGSVLYFIYNSIKGKK